MGAIEAQKVFSHIPVCDVVELSGADAVIFGTPTRFGNMYGQMRQFLDACRQEMNWNIYVLTTEEKANDSI